MFLVIWLILLSPQIFISEKPVHILEGHTAIVYAVAFSPMDSILASGGLDKTLKIWDFPGNKLSITRNFEKSVKKIEFSPDGNWLAVASGKYIYLFSVFAPGRDPTYKGTPKLVFTCDIKDENSNKFLEAGELVNLNIKVTYDGEGYAHGVRVVVKPEEPNLSSLAQDKLLGMIAPGAEKEINFEALVPYSVRNWSSYIRIRVTEEDGSGAPEQKLFVKTKALFPPNFNIVHRIDDSHGNNNGKIECGELINLSIEVQNLGEATARDVAVLLTTESKKIELLKTKQSLGDIGSKKAENASFAFKVDEHFKEESIPCFIKVVESSGFFTVKKDMVFPVVKSPKGISIEE